jgi:adenylyl- and sulfurtransferase ThiI
LAETTIVGWTGRGKIADLERSVDRILGLDGIHARTRSEGRAVQVEGGRPTKVADLLAGLPGVSWISVGRSSGSIEGVIDEVSKLARVYLGSRKKSRKHASFMVKAETSVPEVRPSDLVGRAISAVFDSVPGSRVDEVSPAVTFRLVYGYSAGGSDGGAAGVELRSGPGGAPVDVSDDGESPVSCLVSGGMHSSVLAWYALLLGHRVEMVHVAVGDEQRREVARLYAELSYRVDPAAVSLRILEGASVPGAITSIARMKRGSPLYAGFHSRCGPSALPRLPTNVVSPLYLLPEEVFSRTLSSLSLKGYSATEDWSVRGSGRWTREKSFGGKRSDMHGVLDGLR